MTFGARITGVLKLQAATFEEIEANTTITGQAVAVVVLASIAAGLGVGMMLGPLGLVRSVISALVGWVMWAAVTWVIGTKILPEPDTRSDMGELLRVIGFSSAPNFFAILAVIPVIGTTVRVVVAIWLLAAMVIGVRQALDYKSTGRAIAVVIIGWLLFVAIQALPMGVDAGA